MDNITTKSTINFFVLYVIYLWSGAMLINGQCHINYHFEYYEQSVIHLLGMYNLIWNRQNNAPEKIIDLTKLSNLQMY